MYGWTVIVAENYSDLYNLEYVWFENNSSAGVCLGGFACSTPQMNDLPL